MRLSDSQFLNLSCLPWNPILDTLWVLARDTWVSLRLSNISFGAESLLGKLPVPFCGPGAYAVPPSPPAAHFDLLECRVKNTCGWSPHGGQHHRGAPLLVFQENSLFDPRAKSEDLFTLQRHISLEYSLRLKPFALPCHSPTALQEPCPQTHAVFNKSAPLNSDFILDFPQNQR